MKYGLPDQTIEKLSRVFSRYPQIEKVVLYGSRAKGNFRNGSDIDLTIFGTGIDETMLDRIAAEIDDLLLPYTVDLSFFDAIENRELREHIERVGVVFCDRRVDRS